MTRGSIVRLLEAHNLCLASVTKPVEVSIKSWIPRYWTLRYDGDNKSFIVLQYQILLLQEKESLVVHPYDIEEATLQEIVKFRFSIRSR